MMLPLKTFIRMSRGGKLEPDLACTSVIFLQKEWERENEPKQDALLLLRPSLVKGQMLRGCYLTTFARCIRFRVWQSGVCFCVCVFVHVRE